MEDLVVQRVFGAVAVRVSRLDHQRHVDVVVAVPTSRRTHASAPHAVALERSVGEPVASRRIGRVVRRRGTHRVDGRCRVSVSNSTRTSVPATPVSGGAAAALSFCPLLTTRTSTTTSECRRTARTRRWPCRRSGTPHERAEKVVGVERGDGLVEGRVDLACRTEHQLSYGWSASPPRTLHLAEDLLDAKDVGGRETAVASHVAEDRRRCRVARVAGGVSAC